MLLHAGGDGEDVEVKNNIPRREIRLLNEQLVGALGDGHLFLHRGGLSFFVKRHHNRRRAITPAQARLFQKLLLAGLEADGVHDALALQTFQAFLQNGPFGAVHHHRHAGDVRIHGEQVEKAPHTIFRIQQPFIEADVDDIRAVFHLLTRE